MTYFQVLNVSVAFEQLTSESHLTTISNGQTLAYLHDNDNFQSMDMRPVPLCGGLNIMLKLGIQLYGIMMIHCFQNIQLQVVLTRSVSVLLQDT